MVNIDLEMVEASANIIKSKQGGIGTRSHKDSPLAFIRKSSRDLGMRRASRSSNLP